MNHTPKNGTTVTDCQTDFAGVVDGHCYYADGKHTVLVTPNDSKIEPRWVDVRRLDWNPEAPLVDCYGERA